MQRKETEKTAKAEGTADENARGQKESCLEWLDARGLEWSGERHEQPRTRQELGNHAKGFEL